MKFFLQKKNKLYLLMIVMTGVVTSLLCYAVHGHALSYSYFSLYPEIITVMFSLHIILFSFINMAFLSKKERVYLLPFALGFFFSALFLFFALFIYYRYIDASGIVTSSIATSYFIRSFLLSLFFLQGLLLYSVHQKPIAGFVQKAVFAFQIVSGISFTVAFVFSFLGSHAFLNIIKYNFYDSWVVFFLTGMWAVNLILTAYLSRLKNPFWTAIFITMAVYLISLVIMYASRTFEQRNWYAARVFEIIGTLSVLHLLLHDVFNRYKQSEKDRDLSRFYSERDGMTMLFNRKCYHNKMSEFLSQNVGSEVSVLVGDIDFFKRVNDTWGHLQGDKVIIRISRMIVESIRSGDIPGRIGGEEFSIFLPFTSEATAFNIAERIRQKVENGDSLTTEGDFPAKLTISFGLYHEIISSQSSADTCIDCADKALYAAKNSGRNRTAVFRG